MKLYALEPIAAFMTSWAAVTGLAPGFDSLIEKGGAISILGVVVWLLMKGVIATLEKVKDILEKVMPEITKLTEAVNRLDDTVEKHSCKFKGDQ